MDRSGIYCIFGVLAFFLVDIAATALFSNFYGGYQCGNYAAITGKETKWLAFDSCYVKTERGWQKWDEYTARAIASEGLKK